jgi:hypothetical protein
MTMQPGSIALLVCAALTVMPTSATAQTPAVARASPLKPPAAEVDLINPDRPGIADGSTVIGRGRIQVEAGFQQEFRKSDGHTDSTRFLPALLRIGLSDRWEARVEGNTYTRFEDTTDGVAPNHASGFAPVSLGAKFHIHDGDGFHQPSLGAILRAFPASGSGGYSTHLVTGDLRLAGDWDITPRVSLNPNVGIASYEDDNGRRFATGLFALTVTGFNEAKTLSPFIDAGVQTAEGRDAGSSIILDAGLGYIVGHTVQLDISGGIGPHGNTPPNRFIAAGISVRFRTSGRSSRN